MQSIDKETFQAFRDKFYDNPHSLDKMELLMMVDYLLQELPEDERIQYFIERKKRKENEN